MKPLLDVSAEWLEADGLGGFASGPVRGPRTRRYHAVLLTATTPPTGRFVLVNGIDAHVETAEGKYALTAQRYTPESVSPDGDRRVTGFEADPWPKWNFALEDGTVVAHELFVPKGAPLVVLTWRLVGTPRPATLSVRPFLSGRDYHALHHENGDLRFDGETRRDTVTWRTYASVPPVTALANGGYFHAPHWYRNFLYSEERARGLDHVEDLATPGYFRFDLERGEAILVLAAEGEAASALRDAASAEAVVSNYRASERKRRSGFASRLERSADAYLVRRGRGQTIVAGYPWFTDWGRDTFIALRGLCLATGRLDEARDILVEWAHAVSEGMLPNRFPDRPEEAPEFNAVDASLWYVVAVGEYLDATRRRSGRGACWVCGGRSGCLETAVTSILEGYSSGTRHGIRADDDGLLAAGEAGVQLTWMDAKVGDWVVTPRIGKPVEVQALWVNALAVGAAFDPKWQAALERARAADRSTTSSTRTIAQAPSIRPSVRTRSSPWGACPLPSWTASEREPSWTPSKPSCSRRSGCALSSRRRLGTRRATRAGCGSGTVPTTRARCGPGWRAPSSRPGCASVAARPRRRPQPASASSRRCSVIWTKPASATSPRSPTPRRRTRPVDVPSRPGPWASCSASSASSATSNHGAAATSNAEEGDMGERAIEMLFALIAAALVACGEIVELFEPKAPAAEWQYRSYRAALRFARAAR
jgi:predicted glycogen debranching enzyme